MQRISTAVIAVFCALGPAYAASVPLPQEVAAHIEDMKHSCREEGGTPLPPEKTFLVSGDLTGKGTTDWAIDEAGFNCDGASSIFGGSGGSQVYVFIGITGNRARQAFQQGADGMRLTRRGKHDTLWLTVGGPLCGQSGELSHADSVACERPLVWNEAAQKFDFAPFSAVRRLNPLR